MKRASTRTRAASGEKSALLLRLRRLEGQVQGIIRMVETDRYCVDVLGQMSAARSALTAASLLLLQRHLRGCVQDAFRSGKGGASLSEMDKILRQFLR